MNSFKGGFNLEDVRRHPLFEGKNTLKNFYEYNYVIPKCVELPEEIRTFFG